MIPRLRALGLSLLLLPGSIPAEATGWLEARIEIEELAEANELELALARGDAYLALIEAEFGPDSQELADAHHLLADIYRRDRNFEEAELAQLRTIQIMERREGRTSTSLIEPFVWLGETYHASGQLDLSVAAYEEARAIGRRAFGLLNQEQIAIVDRMTSVALARGDFEEARNLQRDALAIVQRFHGEESLEFVNASFDFAKWLVRSNATEDAMRAYLDVESIIGQNFNDDPIQKVRLLQSSADFLREAGPQVLRMRTNPDELEHALDIVDALDMPNPRLRAEVLRDLGDWNVSLGLDRRVAEPYREAWEELGKLEDAEAVREEWFSALTMVRNAGIVSPFLSTDPEAPWGRVEIGFTLDATGRAVGMEIIRSEPAGLLDGAAMRQVANARFRPRMVDGEVVNSRGVVGWDFQYDPEWQSRGVAESGPPGFGQGPGAFRGRGPGPGPGSGGSAAAPADANGNADAGASADADTGTETETASDAAASPAESPETDPGADGD